MILDPWMPFSIRDDALYLFLGNQGIFLCMSRSSDFRIILLPRLPISRKWLLRHSFPITAAGPWRILTAFPCILADYPY
jgi:hypothetical protein